MGILSFLADNAGKVYRLFGNIWYAVDDLAGNLYNGIAVFFRFTFPLFFSRLLDFIPNLISIASWMFGAIFQIVTSMFSSLMMLVYSLFGALVTLSTQMFGTLVSLVFSMYAQLSLLVFSLFENIISLTTSLFGAVLSLTTSMFTQLLAYSFSWFSQANIIFSSLFGSLIHLTSGFIFGSINLLIAFLPMLTGLAKMPLFILSYLVSSGYSMFVNGLSSIYPFIAEIVTHIVPTVRSLISVLPNLFMLTTSTVFSSLSILVSDFSKGLPAVTEIIKRNLENWFIDKFFDFFEKAIDRFW